MNAALKHLNRFSTPAKALNDPAPDDAQLAEILQVAMSAPDHGRLPDVDAAYLAKQREKPLRSPLIVVVVASLVESEKIPEIEQMLSAGAAAHNVLLASNALGYGSIWLTGANAYDDYVRSKLGLAENERIVGFIFLGTPQLDIPPRKLPPVEDYLSNWE
jgi:nitroreductase